MVQSYERLLLRYNIISKYQTIMSLSRILATKWYLKQFKLLPKAQEFTSLYSKNY